MQGNLRHFRQRRLTPEEGRRAAEALRAIPVEHRRGRERELSLDDPETLLPLLEALRTKCETDPANVHEEATFLYSFLEELKPDYPASAFLLDEREYFLGESARIIGGVCRYLSRREECRRWLDLSEAWFLLTENAAGNISKVHYQRLALKVEERDFAPVLELLPR